MEAKAFGLIDVVLGDTSDIVVVGPREFNVSLLPKLKEIASITSVDLFSKNEQL